MALTIKINDNPYLAEAGETVIAVADRVGVNIPRFCYHKNLSIAANCRMCLIEVAGVSKTQPACSTPVSDGMKVYTYSTLAKKSQKAVMSFLLINHPLDCPICDQGGECELQDVALTYGRDASDFRESKRTMADKDLGALIQTDMTRCIHCTRCIRFGKEIAGIVEMGGTGRGEHLSIEPYLELGIDSELSGNIIDICPVGALTSKPFRYTIRSWQMMSHSSISRHDSVGSHLWVQSYNNEVKRVVARENEALNETWIADRDRFSYEGLKHPNRLLAPKIKIENIWQTVSWEVALAFVAKRLSKILKTHHAKQFAALSAPSATLEEFYLLEKLVRALGSPHLDHRLHQLDFDSASYFPSNINLKTLAQSDYILIIGSYTRLEAPMLHHRVRQAANKGAKIIFINVAHFDFNIINSTQIITSLPEINLQLAGILKALMQINDIKIPENLAQILISKTHQNIAQNLTKAKKSALIIGEHISFSKTYSVCAQLAKHIAHLSNSGIINAAMKANAHSAYFAKMLPRGKEGYTTSEILQKNLRAYLLLDIYPEYDLNQVETAISAFKQADFVLSLNSFTSEVINEYAHAILPIASFFETSATHINLIGDLEFSRASARAPGEAKPAWKVIKVLADLLEIAHFDYSNAQQIYTEIKSNVNMAHTKEIAIANLIFTNTKSSENNKNPTTQIETIWQNNPYAIDGLLRHSISLAKTKIGKINTARMTENTVKKLALDSKNNYHNVPILIDSTMADNTIFVQTNIAKYQIKVE